MKDFLKEQKIKHLTKSIPDLLEGDSVNMYNNNYTILKNLNNKCVIMIDEYGQKVAIPNSELKLLVKNSVAKLNKAMGEGSRGGRIVGHTKSGKPIYESGQVNDNRVRAKKNVYMDPSTGKHYHGADDNSEEAHWAHLASEEDKQTVKRMNDAVRNNKDIDPKHYREIAGKLQQWMQSKTELKGLLKYHNEQFKGEGTQPSNKERDAMQSKQQEALKHKKELFELIKRVKGNK